MSADNQTALVMIDEFIASTDMMVSTKDFLLKLKQCLTTEVQSVEEVKTEVLQGSKVIISCDASIKQNPGGPASVGIVVESPKADKPLEIAKITPAITNNQAEYDAIYVGLTSYFNLVNNPGMPVEIRSDSQLVIKQLKDEITCQDKKLVNRKEIIQEFVRSVPVPIVFVWRPRNSTPGLLRANHLAQDLLGVSRH